MADALKAFRELIVKETEVDEGTIIAINDDGTFRVSTRLGVSNASGDVNFFQVGDVIKVLNGVISSKKSVEDSLVVHER